MKIWFLLELKFTVPGKNCQRRSIEDKIIPLGRFGTKLYQYESLQTLAKNSSGIILVKENTTQIQTLQQETLNDYGKNRNYPGNRLINLHSSVKCNILQFKAFLSGRKLEPFSLVVEAKFVLVLLRMIGWELFVRESSYRF